MDTLQPRPSAVRPDGSTHGTKITIAELSQCLVLKLLPSPDLLPGIQNPVLQSNLGRRKLYGWGLTIRRNEKEKNNIKIRIGPPSFPIVFLSSPASLPWWWCPRWKSAFEFGAADGRPFENRIGALNNKQEAHEMCVAKYRGRCVTEFSGEVGHEATAHVIWKQRIVICFPRTPR